MTRARVLAAVAVAGVLAGCGTAAAAPAPRVTLRATCAVVGHAGYAVRLTNTSRYTDTMAGLKILFYGAGSGEVARELAPAHGLIRPGKSRTWLYRNTPAGGATCDVDQEFFDAHMS